MAEDRPFGMDGLEVAGPELRMALLGLEQGAYDHDSLRPSIGAGNTVDIASGWGVVQGDFSGIQGKYAVYNNASKNSAVFEGGGIPAAAGQPAVHQIVAKVWDAAYEAVGVNGRRWRLMVVAGAPAAGASLTNRTGAANLEADPWKNSMPICDVLRNVDGTIAIQDRRLWAGGKVQSGIALPVGTAPHGSVFHLEVDTAGAMGGPYIFPMRYKLLNTDGSPFTGAHKWMACGNSSELLVKDNTTQTILSSTATALAGSPSFAVPFAGVWRVLNGFGGYIGSAALGNRAVQSVFNNGVDSGLVAASGAIERTEVSARADLTIAVAGHIVQLRQLSNSGASTATFNSRTLAVAPIRLA